MIPLLRRGARRIVPLALLSLASACSDGTGSGATAVSTVDMSPVSAVIQAGAAMQLTATPRDASGAAIQNAGIAWKSSSNAVATVTADGMVTAGAVGGPVTITATSGGKSGTAQLTVETRIATAVTTAPDFATVSVGGTTQITAQARDAAGVILNPAVAWSSLATDRATVAGVGAGATVSGVAPGVTRIAARVNTAADTSLLAVLGPQSILSTGFIDGRYSATVTRGQTVNVPVVLDMSRASAGGDLGSIRFDLMYNTAILSYRSAAVGVNGSATAGVVTPGTFRFVFTGTAPQGRSSLTLVTLTFDVPQTAPLNANTVLVMNYTGAFTSTAGQPYELPVTAWGRLRVAP